MLADIATGNTDWADVLFLIAAVVFAVAVILDIARTRTYENILVPVGLCLVAVAWLVI